MSSEVSDDDVQRLSSDALERLSGHMSPSFWRTAIATQLERLEADQRLVLAQVPTAPSTRREEMLAAHRALMADAHFLLVAVRMLLRVRTRIIELTADEAAINAADEFDRLVPDARNLRNILEHVDEYTVGLGDLQRRGEIDRDDRNPSSFFQSSQDPEAEVSVVFGKCRIALKSTARLGIELADLLQNVRDEHTARPATASVDAR